MSPDLKSMTLKLRPGVVFHDGTPCNCCCEVQHRTHDGQEAQHHEPAALGSACRGRNSRRFHCYLAHRRGRLQRCRTRSHTAPAPSSRPRMSKSSVRQAWCRSRPGPYMLESFNPGQELVLKAFDKYWGGKQGADRLVFRSIPRSCHPDQRPAHGSRRRHRCSAGATRAKSLAGSERADSAQGRSASVRRRLQLCTGAAARPARAPSPESSGARRSDRAASSLAMPRHRTHRSPSTRLGTRPLERRPSIKPRQRRCSPRRAINPVRAVSWPRTDGPSR